MSEVFKLGCKVEERANQREFKPGELMTVVFDYGSSVHVNNPPPGSGFEHGKYMTPEEFTERAKAYLSGR